MARIAAQDEVVELCRDLIRIDTTNDGDGCGNERPAAEYIAEKLAEVGLDCTLVESAPGRASVVTRVEGADRSRGALLIHGHLDVVPADPAEWQVPPFAGEVRDGCVWGRGAVDMKDMDAMTLAVVRGLVRSGRKPPRDLVLAFVADEEAGGVLGARWLVDHHPELFEGCTEAISEVGGFSYTISDDLRLYLIEAAQKGSVSLQLTVAGRAGHGSLATDDNAVTALCEAVTRVGRHTFPLQITKTVRTFLDVVEDALGTTLDVDHLDSMIAKFGPIARMIDATVRNTANPTQLEAGYKVNVVPATATGYIDGRFLPSQEEASVREIDELIGPDVRRNWGVFNPAVETNFDGALIDAMGAALRAEDPGAGTVPYLQPGGTDAKWFNRFGIRCFGFSPLRLPPDFDFAGMFHGVDERVPVEALRFGVRVLDRFLTAS